MASQRDISGSADDAAPGPQRADWGSAPATVRSAVEALIGTVSASVTTRAGLSSQLASTLHVPGESVRRTRPRPAPSRDEPSGGGWPCWAVLAPLLRRPLSHRPIRRVR